ncbi:MAG: RloB domain-containing protein [Muribaculaceae bacterium]|nr:RloB domain-containing protein [Muribaculaceae bacterium]
MARKTKSLPQRSPIPTIVGAGITEQFYFSHLKSILGCQVKIRPRFFGQEDIFQLSKKIEAVLNEGGIAIAVFDADVAYTNREERDKLAALRKRYENNTRVILCDSMPSIEYWFLLHFANVHRLFTTSESVTKELSKHLPLYEKTTRYLSNPAWVAQLSSDGKIKTALQNASKHETGQSYTKIPRAIGVIMPAGELT